jgi:spore photoproduct lyase
MIFPFDKIYIDHQSKQSEVAKRVLSLYDHTKIEFVDIEPYHNTRGAMTAQEYDLSKRTLFITPFSGLFFKRCPGATQKKTLTCCNYHVLNLGSQCNMNCTYCYLQSYLNSRVTKIYSNIDQALNELEDMMKLHPNQPFRVGTGEIIDSLSLDDLTLYSRKLIPLFQKYPDWVLEFKTKSDKIDQFIDIKGSKNIIVSWSINPQYIIQSEEHGTASLDDRLAAAKRCRDQGYKLSFHLDPMIWHHEWQANYSELIQLILSQFSEEDIHVISIGALRFQPEQRLLMKQRFGMNSLVNQAEVFPSDNGKYRYDVNIRSQMFQFAYKKIKELNPKMNVFLCMETPESWINSFEKMPQQIQGLRQIFKPLPEIEQPITNLV